MVTTSLEKVILGGFARLARLLVTLALDPIGAQSTLAETTKPHRFKGPRRKIF